MLKKSEIELRINPVKEKEAVDQGSSFAESNSNNEKEVVEIMIQQTEAFKKQYNYLFEAISTKNSDFFLEEKVSNIFLRPKIFLIIVLIMRLKGCQDIVSSDNYCHS